MGVKVSWTVKWVKSGDVKLAPWNTQCHDEENLEQIRQSLRTFGMVRPLLVWRQTGEIVEGNGRYMVLKEEIEAGRMEDKIPVIYCDGDEREIKLLSVALNKIQSKTDEVKLAQLLRSLPELDPQMLTAAALSPEELCILQAPIEPIAMPEMLPSLEILQRDTTKTLPLAGAYRQDWEAAVERLKANKIDRKHWLGVLCRGFLAYSDDIRQLVEEEEEERKDEKTAAADDDLSFLLE